MNLYSSHSGTSAYVILKNLNIYHLIGHFGSCILLICFNFHQNKVSSFSKRLTYENGYIFLNSYCFLYVCVCRVCVCGEQSCLGTSLLIDPICEEESYQDGSLMITCMPSRNEVTQLSVTGEWSTAKVHEVCNLNFCAAV